MEPQMPTSFIPKKPISSVAPSSSPRGHQATGLLSFLTIMIVIATIGAFGWVYVDEKQLKSKLVSLSVSITESRNNIGSAFVTDIKRLSQRIEGGKVLIDNHIVVSPIFTALQEATLKTVQYKNFTYTFAKDAATNAKTVEVELAGTAKSYQTLALQSDEFTKNLFVKNPIFSGLTIDEKTNRVDFKLAFTVDAQSLSYDAFVAARAAMAAAALANPITP